MPYTESNYENAVLLLIEGLGYAHVCGPEAEV